jgi:hypothetical protein
MTNTKKTESRELRDAIWSSALVEAIGSSEYNELRRIVNLRDRFKGKFGGKFETIFEEECYSFVKPISNRILSPYEPLAAASLSSFIFPSRFSEDLRNYWVNLVGEYASAWDSEKFCFEDRSGDCLCDQAFRFIDELDIIAENFSFSDNYMGNLANSLEVPIRIRHEDKKAIGKGSGHYNLISLIEKD